MTPFDLGYAYTMKLAGMWQNFTRRARNAWDIDPLMDEAMAADLRYLDARMTEQSKGWQFDRAQRRSGVAAQEYADRLGQEWKDANDALPHALRERDAAQAAYNAARNDRENAMLAGTGLIAGTALLAPLAMPAASDGDDGWWDA